ncbi:hypothetical protein CL684_03105 [Candidatus Campbellbacteria bacterium]|nr:hypothetical protein [Candidatus Campbellbacteria bacterium]
MPISQSGKNFIAHSKESKICLSCNRLFYNRKCWKSRDTWTNVKYCSERCRQNKKPNS